MKELFKGRDFYYEMIKMHFFLGISITGASNVGTDLVSTNQIADYSFVTQPFALDLFNVLFRCSSGLGPSGRDSNVALGKWYFNGTQVFYNSSRSNCFGPVFEMRAANPRNYPGVVNLYLCGAFTATEEGIYSCIMINSSMMNQTMRVGVYFSGRSESHD